MEEEEGERGDRCRAREGGRGECRRCRIERRSQLLRGFEYLERKNEAGRRRRRKEEGGELQDGYLDDSLFFLQSKNKKAHLEFPKT